MSAQRNSNALSRILAIGLSTLALFGVLVLSFGATTSARAAENFTVASLDYDIPAEITAAAADDSKNLVVMFVQAGCPYCEKMRQRVFPDPKVAAFYVPRFHLIELDIKSSLPAVSHTGKAMSEKKYAQLMRARATPTFVFYSKAAKPVLKLVGYQDAGMFLAAGRYVTTKAYKDGTSFIAFVRAGK